MGGLVEACERDERSWWLLLDCGHWQLRCDLPAPPPRGAAIWCPHCGDTAPRDRARGLDHPDVGADVPGGGAP